MQKWFSTGMLSLSKFPESYMIQTSGKRP